MLQCEQNTELWKKVQEYLRSISEDTFEQWFSKMTALGFEDDVFMIGVPDSFFADWIRDNYSQLLAEAFLKVAGKPVLFDFEEGHDKCRVDIATEGPDLPSLFPDEEKNIPSADVPAFAENCLPHNTFDRFVVGEGNRYAYTAASTAAEKPGTFNPLYIYGGPGLGKTHLIQAVANDVIRHNPQAKVRYTTCESFLNDYVDSLRNKTNFEFRERYRNVDFLLIDDVHILSGKSGLQEEFFNTFNDLHNANKQIILTSDKPPAEIPGLEERLVSRFVSGITTQITPPLFETRLAILRQEQSDMKLKLDDSVLEFIARRITSNVRPLKGALLHLEIYASAMNTQITTDTVETLLADILNKEAENRHVSIEDIQKVVAAHYELHVHDLTGSKRPKNIADARMVAMYLCRKLTNHSHKEIGMAFGGRNHATVIHAVKNVEDNCIKDEECKRTIAAIQHRLQIESKSGIE